MPNSVKFTKVTATIPERLSKSYHLNADGSLRKESGGQLIKGAIEVLEVSSLAHFGSVLQSLTPQHALIYGLPKKDVGLLHSKSYHNKLASPANATTRTKDEFTWPSEGGVMMLDYDPRSDEVPMSRTALVQALRDAVPGLQNASMLWWPSASSCIWAEGSELKGTDGQRLYLFVKDAQDIPRAGKVLEQRLWLAGLGYIFVSKSGSLLERCLFDTAVWQPTRFDFIGGSNLSAGLEQRRGAPIIIEGEAEFVDTSEVFAPLSRDELKKFTAEVMLSKDALKSEARKVQDEWVTDRVRDMTLANPAEDKKSSDEFRQIAVHAIDTGQLSDDFVLNIQIGGQVQPVKVSDVLQDPYTYHGSLTLDPLEPNYDGGRLVGRLFLCQSKPVLYSFARGGKTYHLSKKKSRVELVSGHMVEAVEETVRILRQDPQSFDYGAQLVTIDAGVIYPMCEHALSFHIGERIQYCRMTSEGLRDVDVPVKLVRQVLAQKTRRQLKPLKGLLTGPTILLDGTILDRVGYDHASGLFCDFDKGSVPEIPVEPNTSDAVDALQTLLKPFETFPFVDALSKGILLAALLTAAVRPVLKTAPAFAFDAPIQGSGKALLASCVGALMEGKSPDIWPHVNTQNDDEIRKRLFAVLASGCQTLIWDNVIGTFDSASMAGFITADAMVDRVLGKSESIRIPNRIMLLLTGNNLILAGDMPRRVLICRIDPQTDQPFAREFPLDPLEYVLLHRNELLAAACTLIRARFIHMKTPAAGRLASFEEWDVMVRQTVVWANEALMPGEFGDPMDLVRQAQTADPEAEMLFALLEALKDEFGNREFTAKDVHVKVNTISMSTNLGEALRDIAGDSALKSTRAVGRALTYRKERIVHGLCLAARTDTSSKSQVYRVKVLNDGFGGFNGLKSTQGENDVASKNTDHGKLNPLNPLNPVKTEDEEF